MRRVSLIAVLIGPKSAVADTVATSFERAFVRVLRFEAAAAAYETLAVAMPQVVVVLGTLAGDEHDALADRTTAVGALLMYVDPQLDTATLDGLVARAAKAAFERKTLRDEAAPAGTPSLPPEEIDSKW